MIYLHVWCVFRVLCVIYDVVAEAVIERKAKDNVTAVVILFEKPV